MNIETDPTRRRVNKLTVASRVQFTLRVVDLIYHYLVFSTYN
jgi:hypothetical protein